jgi:hypothetical protein
MPGILAEFYSIAGDKDRALYWLEYVCRHKHPATDGEPLWLKGNPLFASLRPDPRFKELVRRVGLPE